MLVHPLFSLAFLVFVVTVSILNPREFLFSYLSDLFGGNTEEVISSEESEPSSLLDSVLNFALSFALQPSRSGEQQVPVSPRASTHPVVQESVPSPSSPSSSLPPIITGDSVATGIGHGGARGSEASEAQWGRGSAAQLAYMKAKGPKYYTGRDVILSSGVLNSGDLESVRKQLEFLKSSGARSVRVAGAPLTGRFSGLNQKLNDLSNLYGFSFMGGYKSSDGVHPADYKGYGAR